MEGPCQSRLLAAERNPPHQQDGRLRSESLAALPQIPHYTCAILLPRGMTAQRLINSYRQILGQLIALIRGPL